ncbi:MAG: OmpA family protein, partial [Luteimonas sp.]
TVTDPLLPTLACTIATLAPGATASCAATGNTYVITAADVTAGARANTATATGNAPGSIPDPTTSDTVSTPTTAAVPGFSLLKSASAPIDADGNGVTDAGDTIAYSFTVTNTGNTPLNAVVVNDIKLSPTPIACAPTNVAVGGNAACGPVTYTITTADVTAGSVVNSATATGTPPGGTPITSAPSTTNTPTTAPAPSLSSSKTLSGTVDADNSGGISAGDTLTYTVTVTNTGNVPLNNIVINDTRITPSSVTCASVIPNGTCVLTGAYVVSQADVDAGTIVNTAGIVTQAPPGGPPLPPQACPAGSTDPRCAPSVSTPVVQRPAIATAKTATLTTDNGTPGAGNAGDVITYTVTVANTGNVTLLNLVVTDSFEGGAPTTLACSPITLAPGASATCASYTHTITQAEVDAGGTLDNSATATAQSSGGAQTVSGTSSATVTLDAVPTTVRITKTATPHDVKIGDLVRYTLIIENTGAVNVVDASIVDTPPAGFTFVANSLTVADDNGAGRLVGTYPVRIDQIDVAAGARATVTYLLRIGAGVRPGIHTNSAYVQDNGATVSNVATADVQMVADPLLDESLIVGTVFDDRDSDGWQDSAAMNDVRVQGGFAATAYVAGSTTVDRGKGPAPEADASAPLLHGIALGNVAARQSDADLASTHAIVVSQTLSALDFNDDFALTTKQGVTVRMDAAGNTRIERNGGDAAKGLTAAAPSVQRRVSRIENGYRVDYIVGNDGVDERGIPGVRIASVEGLLIETDQFGRYHLVGVQGGPWERGRNFILKVDPATLPPGSAFTTHNPLLRRVTPGLPTRFDFGVKLPAGLVQGGQQAIELELGAVMFDAESAKLRERYLMVVDKMAEQVRQHEGGEVVIAANGGEALAYERAKVVQAALLERLPPEQAQALKVSLRTDLAEPSSTLLTLDAQGNAASPVLGTVLFDTDRSEIKPQYAPVIAAIAADIERIGGGVIGVVGHADKRGSDAYNVALGLRRAKAVYEAIAAQLGAQARAKLRVEISEDPTAPVAGERGL